MASHRPLPSTCDGLPIVAIGAALMAAAPSGGRRRAADAEPSQTDGAQAIAESGRQAARPVVYSPRWRFDRC